MAEVPLALALAGFAGFVRYIQRFTLSPRPPWEWANAGVSVVTGSFVGFLALMLLPDKTDKDYGHFFIAMAGYGGPVTLDFLFQVFKDIAGRFVNGPKSN